MIDQQPATGFEELGLGVHLVSSIRALGFERPTPIQCEAIPVLLEGRDLLGQAATGTGKTAAFALPILQRLPRAQLPGRPGALVLAPTRELALQVADAVRSYAEEGGARVLALYGGQPIFRQLQALREPVDVVVATPGRALDHLERGTLSLDDVVTVVLDEADEMLDMGFADDLEAILSRAPAERQTALFSATLPGRIAEVARRHLRDPVHIAVARERVPEGEAPRVREAAVLVRREHKIEALARLLAWEEPGSALLFCHTRVEVDRVGQALEALGHRVEVLHGGMSQERREQVLRRLRDGVSRLLVATDVAARGLDVDVLTHVINVDLPSSPEVYVHRVGRVGRAGREGVALSLVEPRQRRLLSLVERVAKRRIERAYVPDDGALAARRRERLADRVRSAAGGEIPAGLRAVYDALRRDLEPESLALAALALAAGVEAPPPPVDRPAPAPPVDPPADEDADAAAVEGPEAPRGAAEPRADRPHAPPRGTGDLRADRRFDDRRAAGMSDRRAGRGSDRAGDGGLHRLDRPHPARHPEALRGGRPVRLWIGAGRNVGLRPGDLVGAITGEAGVHGRSVGAIRIAERFTVVEIDERHAQRVLDALSRATLRGRKVKVRRDRTADP